VFEIESGHVSLRLSSKLHKHNLVRGLSVMSFKDNLLCETCIKGKRINISLWSINKFQGRDI